MHNTLLTDDRLEVIARRCKETAHLPGVMAECGVYKGGSAALISNTCPQKVLHLFDALGLPHDDIPGGGHRAGEFAAVEAEVRAFLSGCNVVFHFGFFPDTAKGLEEENFSFVHLDFDLYKSTKAALEFFIPRMVKNSFIVLDDYGWQACPGVKLACDELGLDVVPTAPQQGVVYF